MEPEVFDDYNYKPYFELLALKPLRGIMSATCFKKTQRIVLLLGTTADAKAYNKETHNYPKT
jgi:hypothetical protein